MNGKNRNMTRVLQLWASAVLACALLPASAAAATFEDFGIESVSAALSSPAAGMHPDLSVGFVLKSEEMESLPGTDIAVGRLQDSSIELPPGLIGNPTNFPTCTTGQFAGNTFGNCPVDSQIGTIELHLSDTASGTHRITPLYNLDVPGGDGVARFGFWAVVYPVFIDVKVRTADDYGLTATAHGAPGLAAAISVTANLWGDPASPAHDPQRLTSFESNFCETACMAPGGERPSGLLPVPFISNPTACGPQRDVGFAVTSYQLPGRTFTASAPLPPITSCDAIPFHPSLQVTPTNRRAGAPTGLSVVLRVPQSNALNLPATAALRQAKVTLPEGLTISSSAADGLVACSDAQVGLGAEAASNCPASAKLGTATLVSPDLSEPLHGSIYQRTPKPGHLFRLWLVTDEMGLHLKIPGEVIANPVDGRLTATFDETPPLPVEEIDLEFKSGDRAPLKNPDACGSYSTGYELTPWSGHPPVTGRSTMTIDEGCRVAGFSPELSAGVTQPIAGSYSPLILDLKRQDREQNLSSFEVDLRAGELAKLRGVAQCLGAAAATGACPADSQIGTVDVSSGVGSQPLWIPQPGKAPTAVFLGGPYKGAPLSAVAKVPVQAGPFDLGTVVVQSAIQVDPSTAAVTVRTDPLPQILDGVPIRYRTIHVGVDRSQFAINPTNCSVATVSSRVASAEGGVAHPSDRFQIGECGALAFGPRLALRLSGPTQRGKNPRLRAVLTQPAGQANIHRVSVVLPPSEFIDNRHINDPCTRVQFGAGGGNGAQCPAGSVLGYAEAFSPLLDQPLKGPVYFRSNGGERELPDLVASLDGQIHINVVGAIDSVHRKGSEISRTRTTFANVPDAAVSKFVLTLKGGKSGLLQNSTNLCKAKGVAQVRTVGHNGRFRDFSAKLATSCGKHDGRLRRR
jgi:hypothetical protein